MGLTKRGREGGLTWDQEGRPLQREAELWMDRISMELREKQKPGEMEWEHCR